MKLNQIKYFAYKILNYFPHSIKKPILSVLSIIFLIVFINTICSIIYQNFNIPIALYVIKTVAMLKEILFDNIILFIAAKLNIVYFLALVIYILALALIIYLLKARTRDIKIMMVLIILNIAVYSYT